MEQCTPFFSIIVPAYNRGHLICSTLDGIFKQTYSDFEVIVVDDGSTDSTQEAINSFSDSRLQYFLIPNGERGRARNFGALQAKGKYLNFFDSDDIMYPNHLETASKFAVSNQNPGVFHVGYEIIDENGHSVLQEHNFNYDIRKRLIKTNFLGCNSVFVREDIFLNNKFNEDRVLASSEDWEIWLRYAARFKILSCNKVTFAIRNHSGRSLFSLATESVIQRDNALLRYLLQDKMFTTSFKKDLPLFIADRYTFYSLLLSLERKKIKALSFLVVALKCTIKVLSRKRFWACFKLIIVK